ncbi:MAG TPA: hypothetical protein VH298_10990 [Jatrophihabitans sp.]|nr:hypothetical protein [Jatrophihabitans sp.]
MAGPDVTRCNYDGELTVEVDWSGILNELAPNYNVTVFDGGAELKSGSGAGESGTVTLDGPLDPGSLQYSVAVAPGRSGNAYGEPLVVIPARLADLTATWVGGTELEVAWTLPNALANGAQLRVVDANHASYGSGWIQGSSGVLTLSRPLDPAGSYTLYGAAALRDSSGPESSLRQSTGPEVPLPLVAQALPLTSLVYDRTQRVLSLQLSAAPPAAVRPGIVLFADGVQQARYLGDAGQQSFTAQLQAALDPAVHYTVRPFLRAGDADGPFGPAVTVMVSAPAVTSVGWSGDNLEVSWAPLAGPPWPTGGALAFAGQGRHPGPLRVAEATSWSGVPAPPFDPWQSEPYTVTAANTRGVATGPMGPGLAVIVDADLLLTASYDGTVLQASWSPGSWPGATGARLLVLAGDTVIAAMDAGLADAGAAVPVDLAAGRDYTAAMQWIGDRSTGPIGLRSAPLLTEPVQVTRLLTDPGTGLPTVYWPAMTDPAGVTYQLQLLRDGEPDGPPIPAPSASLTLGQPLVPGARQAVRVRAVRTVADCTLTGPFGPTLALPVGLPAIEAVEYDGATALVRWRGVDGATGYELDIVVDGTADRAGHAEAGTADREARVTVTPAPDPGKAWTVVVRALAGLSSGARATAPLVTPALRPALDGVDGVPLPRLFRASTLAAAPQPITAYLPPLGITATSVPASPPANAPFVIASNPDPATRDAFPYTLSIGGAALSFAAADRATVRTSYLALLKEAEALKPAMTPRAVTTVRDVIARLMPQTFAETLYYAYGLSNPGSAVDLRPGTILRVSSPPYQVIPGSKPSMDYQTGYAAGPVVDFEIEDYLAGTSWLTGFDAFVAWLVSNGNLAVPDPGHSGDWGSVSGAADPADLYFPTMRRPFYRLFFPQTLPNTSDPVVSQLGRQFALLGADTFTAISNATPTKPTDARGMLFRGRSVLRVCLRVRVNGADTVVPVGTTVGNLLGRIGRRPPGAPPAVRGLTLVRAPGAAVLDPSGYDAGAGQPVLLGWRGVGFAPGGDALALPLLPGDQLSIGDQP